MSIETIKYTCVCCLGESDVNIKHHLDEGVYIECDCGERCEPSSSDEIKSILNTD